jgi:hypothetical protein
MRRSFRLCARNRPGFAMTSVNGAECQDGALLSAAAHGDGVAVTKLLGEDDSVKVAALLLAATAIMSRPRAPVSAFSFPAAR